jgi:hypothetical protein
LETIPHLPLAGTKLVTLGWANTFPFVLKGVGLKGARFPLLKLDSGLYMFENRAVRLEGDGSPTTEKMAGVVL